MNIVGGSDKFRIQNSECRTRGQPVFYFCRLSPVPCLLPPMRLGLINSAWVQANQPTVYGLRQTKELGFDTIDIFVDPLDIEVKERRLIKDECDRLKLPIVSIACVAVGLMDFNPSVQRFHLDR